MEAMQQNMEAALRNIAANTTRRRMHIQGLSGHQATGVKGSY
jgi:hypothetical protein